MSCRGRSQSEDSSSCKKNVLQSTLGVSEEEMKRNNAYKKLGVTEEDYVKANEVMSSIDKELNIQTKEERIIGYSSAQIKRVKAVNVLGTSEEEIDLTRAKTVGSIGVRK